MQRDGEVQQKNAQLQEHTGQPAQGVEPNHAGTSTQTERQLAVERQKAEEYLDLLRQTQADFVNYRRRISQEQTEERTKAQLAVLTRRWGRRNGQRCLKGRSYMLLGPAMS